MVGLSSYIPSTEHHVMPHDSHYMLVLWFADARKVGAHAVFLAWVQGRIATPQGNEIYTDHSFISYN